ncbi:MAG TPA: cyclic nucleotide-binding domain-containing protein [Acidimicrobiia bacterium]|jgi:CRP-like cAMP-binding protein|nr:cyclic nucleotide-binding domain-containing protein [Acidimicrobiia bacterium]
MNRTYFTELQDTWLFSDCSKRELAALDPLCTPLDIPAGRVLMREGDLARDCFIVLEGHAVAERAHTTLGEFTAHAVVGALALVDGSLHTATVTAATPMRILVIDRGAFSALASGRYGWSIQHRIDVIAAEQRPTTATAIAAPVTNAHDTNATPEGALAHV